jgi:arylsulfatase
MSDPDRTMLPIRRAPFQGVANKTLDGSRPDWNLIGHPEPPDGAPNVLLVLIDDAGFGNPGTFGGPISTAVHADGRAGLRYNRFHVTALRSPTRAALHRAEQPRGRFRSVGERPSGFRATGTPARLRAGLRSWRNGYSTAAFGKWYPGPRTASKVRRLGRRPTGWALTTSTVSGR